MEYTQSLRPVRHPEVPMADCPHYPLQDQVLARVLKNGSVSPLCLSLEAEEKCPANVPIITDDKNLALSVCAEKPGGCGNSVSGPLPPKTEVQGGPHSPERTRGCLAKQGPSHTQVMSAPYLCLPLEPTMFSAT